jgi:hypothetical protein
MVKLYQPEIGRARVDRIKNLLATFPYLLRHHVRSGCLCSDQDPLEMEPTYRMVLYNSARANVVDTRYEGDKTSGGITRVNDIVTATTTSISSPSHLNKHHKRDNNPCYVDTRELPWSLLKDTDEDALLGVARAINKPLWVLDRLGREIMDVPFSSQYFCSRERMALLSQVEKLTATIGQCERIHQTSVPLNYARHALRGLSVWLFTLPFCLVQDLGLLTGPLTGVMAWLLFGIYQIGYHVEDPFQGSLRLSILCEAIRSDLLTDLNDSAFQLDIEEDDDDDDDGDHDGTKKDILERFSSSQHALSLPVVLPLPIDPSPPPCLWQPEVLDTHIMEDLQWLKP